MADLGHKETDKFLEQLERKIKMEYKKAEKEIEKKTSDFMAQFAQKDKEKLALVKAGKLTDAQYKKWRLSQIAMSKRWEGMKKTLSEDWYNADKIARKMVRNDIKDVYALNHNYAAYQIEHDTELDTSFTLYNHESVERLLRDDPQVLPHPGKALERKIAEGKAQRWSQKKLQSIMTQSILQGESIPNIAKRLTEEMGEMSAAAAIRNARTMTTAAEAAGRIDAYKQAKGMGIDMMQMWVSTLDGRTRHAHRLLDGQKVEVGEPFKVDGYKLKQPGDLTAPGYLIYNCRCTVIGVIKGSELDKNGLEGMERKSKLGDMSYNEWKKEKAQKEKQPKVSKSIYDVIGQYPKRPRLADFDGDYDALDKAREDYRAKKQEIENTMNEWFDENYGNKTITEQEFSDWCAKNGVIQYGSLEGLDRRALKAYTERYEQLISDFPLVKAEHDYWGHPFEISYETGRSWNAEASHGMAFGSIAYSESNFKQSAIIHFESASKGDFVYGRNPVLCTFDHEFGHQVYDAMKNIREDMTRDDWQRTKDLTNDLLQSLIGKSGISDYATTDDDELFAEGFAAWYGGEKTEFANAMGDFLRRHGVI